MVYVSPLVRAALSHPGKPASVHTLGVMTRSLDIWDDYRVRTASLFHDVGKVINVNFAQRLKGISNPDLYYNHAYLSLLSFLNYLKSRKLGYNIPGVLNGYADFLTVAACVVKHHGALPNFKDLLNKDELQRLKGYLNGSPHMPADEFLSLVNLEKGLTNFSVQGVPDANMLALFSNRKMIADKLGLESEKTNPLNFFLDTRMCFSALVSADKGDAGSQKVDTGKHTKFIKNYYTRVEGFLKGLKSNSPLNALRTEMRGVALDNLKHAIDLNPTQRTFSLTYPTGAGKTAILMALSAQLMKNKSADRVIYSVPFLSITEQIFDIIEKAFEKEKDCIKRIDCKAQPTQDLSYDEASEAGTLIKRFKAFFNKVLKGKTLRDEMIESLLRQDYQESTFNYPMIVTTFVQFFQSFTTCSNRGLMRFSNLQNAVFLIDEVQAVSPSLYSFFVALIDAFCQRFGSYAIISTATMPYFKIPKTSVKATKMFVGYQEPIEIGDLKYYDNDLFNRYNVIPIPGVVNTMSLSLRVAQEKGPTLVVMNTVRDSQDVFNAMQALVDCPVYLLNSNFFAADRRVILDKCKAHINKRERFFLVSTQLIEAGVDIDFDVAFRDIAPLPNIIQTAGRCNRNGLRDKGQVYVFTFIDDELRVRARTIYNGIPDGPFLNYAEQSIFQSGKAIFQEKELLAMQKGFFDWISQNLKFGEWEKDCNFVDQICELMYGEMGAYTVIPAKRYGVQEQFYVPSSASDDTYEQLVEIQGEIAFMEDAPAKPGVDTLKEKLYLKKKLHEHVRKMMDRVVQVNVPDESYIPVLSEYDEMYCHIYKLKPGHYDSVYGFHI
jgi:CRISPR-associated endonuclease/helicase Cas3